MKRFHGSCSPRTVGQFGDPVSGFFGGLLIGQNIYAVTSMKKVYSKTVSAVYTEDYQTVSQKFPNCTADSFAQKFG